MGYLTQNAVKNGIKVRVRRGRDGREHTDYEAYFGTDPFTKAPVRKTRTSKDELLSDIKEFFLRKRDGGEAAAHLTAQQAVDALNALQELANAKVDVSLTQAVRAFLDGSARVSCAVCDVKLKDAYREYLAEKPEGAHKNKIKATTGLWVKDFGDTRPLSAVTAKEVLAYMKLHYGEKKPKTYNSHLLYIKSFVNWCCRDERRYLAESPVKSLKMMEEPWEEPEYMKPTDAERLFRLLESHRDERPDMLAYAVTSFFCGSRSVEILRAAEGEDAAKINIEDETVRIAKGKGYQRGRRPRAFHINSTALAWMKSFDFLAGLKKITKDTQIDMYRLARKVGIPVFQNCGRHTFITMDVAANGDPAKTQANVGTSAKMRAENYCGLASKAEGEAFFAIMPSAPSKLDGLQY